jgi:hypothetical protein
MFIAAAIPILSGKTSLSHAHMFVRLLGRKVMLKILVTDLL